MIKLVKIYNEIKVIGKVTPKLINQLHKDIWKRNDDDDENEIWNNMSGYDKDKWFAVYEKNGVSAPFENNLLYKSQHTLKQIYKDMLEFKAKYNL